MNKSENAVRIFNKYANEYANKFMDVNLYADTFDFFCDAISNKKATVLELACGPGNITRYLLNKRPDLKILATDLAPNMISLAKLNNPTAEVQLLDSRCIATLEKTFDAIMCGFCLPYLSKEEAIEFILDASNALNPKGLVYISTMEDDYTKSGLRKGSKGDEIFMHYHQEDYLVEALRDNGFEILDLQRKIYPTGDEQTIDLIIVARKLG